jgi:hypothetical protein
LVDFQGEPTIIENIPKSISSLVSMSSKIIATASGIINENPGIDVIRYDPKDFPFVYNTDHYIVFEDFYNSPYLKDSIRISGIKESDNLIDFLKSKVLVVGPYQDKNHWIKEIPIFIQNGKRK